MKLEALKLIFMKTRIHYPLPLEYSGPPDPIILQATVKKLENQLEEVTEQLQLKSSKNDSKQIYLLQKRYFRSLFPAPHSSTIEFFQCRGAGIRKRRIARGNLPVEESYEHAPEKPDANDAKGDKQPGKRRRLRKKIPPSLSRAAAQRKAAASPRTRETQSQREGPETEATKLARTTKVPRSSFVV